MIMIWYSLTVCRFISYFTGVFIYKVIQTLMHFLENKNEESYIRKIIIVFYNIRFYNIL